MAEQLCSMMGEIFLGFAALYLQDARHVSAPVISLVLATGMVGAVVGLVVLEQALKRAAGVRLLPWLSLLTLVGVLGFLVAPSLWLAAAALFLFHLSVAGWYPITQAAAYSRLPGRPGTAQAVIALGEPFEIALPVMVGLNCRAMWCAGRAGLPGSGSAGHVADCPPAKPKYTKFRENSKICALLLLCIFLKYVI